MSVENKDDCFIVKEEEAPPKIVIIEEKDCKNFRPHESSKHRYPKLECQNANDLVAISCDRCSKTFKSLYSLEHHRTTVHEYWYFIKDCEICGKTIRGKGQMQRHIRQYHPEATLFKCGQCSKSFRWRSELAWHRKVQHRPIDPQSRIKAVKTNMPVNCSSKIKAKALRCRLCQKSFHSRLAFQRHMDLKHLGQSGCNKCEEVFRTCLDVQYHDCSGKEQNADGENSFICGICGATFATQKYLISHMGLHTGEFEIACGLCNIGFPDVKFYQGHIKEFHSNTVALLMPL